MRYLWLILLVGGCASRVQPTTISMFPPSLEIDKILPAAAKPVECKPQFEPMALNGGMLVESNGKKTQIQAGFLVDECTFARENIGLKAEVKRLTEENEARKQLGDQMFKFGREAEKAYLQRINELEEDPGIWDRIKFDVGLVGGAVITGLLVWAASQIH